MLCTSRSSPLAFCLSVSSVQRFGKGVPILRYFYSTTLSLWCLIFVREPVPEHIHNIISGCVFSYPSPPLTSYSCTIILLRLSSLRVRVASSTLRRLACWASRRRTSSRLWTGIPDDFDCVRAIEHFFDIILFPRMALVGGLLRVAVVCVVPQVCLCPVYCGYPYTDSGRGFNSFYWYCRCSVDSSRRRTCRVGGVGPEKAIVCVHGNTCIPFKF